MGVLQGTVLGLLLFIIVLEALSREFGEACSWNCSVGKTHELLKEKLRKWIKDERFEGGCSRDKGHEV